MKIRRCRGVDFVIRHKRKGGGDRESHGEFVVVEESQEGTARVRAKF